MRLRVSALSLSATILFTSQSLAQNPLTPEDLFDLKTVGQIAVSPDGSATAYSLSVPRNILNGAENGRAQSEIRVSFGNGKNQLYIPKEMGARSLDWLNPSLMTFLAKGDQDKTVSLYKFPINGGAPEKMFAFSEDIRAYRFANDGTTLFFTAREAADKKAKTLKNKGFDANVIDEGGRLTKLYRVDLNGKAEAKFLNVPGHATQFAVSQDGRRVVVALADTPLVGDDIINKKFHIINGRTGRVENVLETEGKIGSATFSPDGNKIAFFAGVDRSDPIARTIAIADAKTGAFEFLTDGDDVDELDLEWTSNSSLRVLSHKGTKSSLFNLSVSGEKTNESVHDDYVITRIDGNGETLAATGHAPNYPSALFVAGDAGQLEKVTSHNAWLGDKALGNQEVVTWKAKDGILVEGILVTPKGRKPRNGWPTITVVHGGPEAHYSNGWVTRYSDPGHFGAAEGYAVFYPNYRGSTGRGQEFAKLDHLDPPAAEFNDIIDGIEALAAQGIVNKEKVGITGGSYGGYASAWGATALTDHFAAAVVFVALTDLTSFMGTTDIPVEMVDSHFKKYPEEDWDMYREWSPIYHAAKSKTPTLILHGEADPRVHPSQSLQLYRYLKRVGQAPVRLVTYPGEGHGNRKAAGQYDYSLRLMRWMEYYLKDGETDELPPIDLEEVRSLAE